MTVCYHDNTTELEHALCIVYCIWCVVCLFIWGETSLSEPILAIVYIIFESRSQTLGIQYMHAPYWERD